MFTDAANFYRITTATSVVNSGTGSSALTKPAGTESASIVPSRKYACDIPSEATFVTDFNVEDGPFTVYLYAKPNPGTVVNVAGVSLDYTGHSYTIKNELGNSVEVAAEPMAHFIVIYISSTEASVFIDGVGGAIPAPVTETAGKVTVRLLSAGGILDMVAARQGGLSTEQIKSASQEYSMIQREPSGTIYMFDENRNLVTRRTVIEKMSLNPGGYEEIDLYGSDCMAFKLEFDSSGSIGVNVNDTVVNSGFTSVDAPGKIIIGSSSGGTITNLVVTEYFSVEMFGSGGTMYSTDEASGRARPTHTQHDNYGNTGTTTIVVNDTVNTISGWFKNVSGTPLPGVTANGTSLIGTGLYVNGKAYTSGAAIGGDWYFLTKVGAVTGTVNIDVPTHAISVSASSLSAVQIDDLYESFFGNPKMTTATEMMTLAEKPSMIISSEWDIVASG